MGGGGEGRQRTRPFKLRLVPQLDTNGKSSLHAVDDKTGEGADGGDEEVGDWSRKQGQLAGEGKRAKLTNRHGTATLAGGGAERGRRATGGSAR